MKKHSWLIALFAILTFAFAALVSCGEDDGTRVVEILFFCQDGYFENGLGFRRAFTGDDGKIAIPEEPTLVKFKFREWNTSANGHDGSVLSAGVVHKRDTTYYAIWDQDSFWVTEEWNFGGIAPDTTVSSFNTWTIEGDKLDALKDADSGSMLRLHFDARGGLGTNRNNWGVGIIGNGGTDVMDFLPLNSPAGSAMLYFIDVEVDWLIEILERGIEDKLIVSTHRQNGDMLKEVYLLEPKEERIVGPRPPKPAEPADRGPAPDPEGRWIADITIDYGLTGDMTQGKGHIAGTQLQLIKDTVAEALANNERVALRLWTRNTGVLLGRDTTSWTDCGRIGGDYDQGALGISGGPIGADRAHLYSHTQVVHLLNLDRDLFLNPYNDNIITLIELWVVPLRYAKIMAGATELQGVVTGRNGAVIYLEDNSGFTFGPTNDSRANYPWFELEFPAGKKLGDYKEIKFDYAIVDPAATSNRRIALIASTSSTLGTSSLTAHVTGGSNLAAPMGSSNGWLAANQVTAPMVPALANSDVPVGGREVTLEILKSLPAYVPAGAAHTTLTNTLAASKLYFSIYENNRDATIRISNIRFIEND